MIIKKEPLKNPLNSKEVIDYKELVRSEIETFNAFKSAQGQLISKYESIIEKLYEYAPIIIAISDVNYETIPYVYVNKYAENELGYSVNDIISGGLKNMFSLYHPDEIEDTRLKFKILQDIFNNSPADEADSYVLEQIKRIKHYKGNFIWFKIRTTLLTRKSDGSPHLILTIMFNVNDSIELQEEKQKILSLEISLLKQKVKSQNEQLQTQLLSSIESSKFFDDIIKYINNISYTMTHEQQIPFNQIVNYIQRNKPNLNFWDEFISRFQHINPNFVKYLSQNYPNLTPTELKICALTKIGLTSKDISSILKISIRSVENHKYNIRNKFELEPYQNLYNFINML